MKRHVKTLLFVAVILALIVVARLFVFVDEPVPVIVTQVASGPVEETVTNTRAGTVRARRRAKLSPEVGGMVVELPFREGQHVKKGDVVLRLDDALQRAELDLTRRELEAQGSQREQACLAAERASRNLERIRKLSEEEIISRDLLDEADTEARRAAAACDAATSSVARAHAAVALAETRVAKMILRAPFDAIVAEVDAEVGEWVTPSPPALPVPAAIDILDQSSIFVSAPMDEVDSARIGLDQRARVSIDSFPETHFWGRITRIAPYVLDIEAQNRTVEIEIDLDDTDVLSKLLPGTSADVEVLLEVREDVLRIPTPALLEGERVLVVVADGKTHRLVSRDVDVGLSNWDFTEIRHGLEPSDRVVVSLDRAEVEAGALVSIEIAER
jgi:HlyD family secretion protein